MRKKLLVIWLIVFVLLIGSGFSIKLGGTESGTSIVDENTFIDDVGNKIEVDGSYSKIISLFNEHTENLFTLGVGDKIIGVNRASNFPFETTNLPSYVYDEESDINNIIEAKPDLVLIAPSINSKYPAFVTRIETAGIKVVSLRPESFEDFDIYMEKLAMLTGTKDKCEVLLKDFHSKLHSLKNKTNAFEIKTDVFFEGSEIGYRTFAEGSLPYIAMENAGGNNIAGPLNSNESSGRLAKYGIEKLEEDKDKIDVYLTLQGGEESGTSLISLKQKDNFKDFKAVKDDRVYEMHRYFIDSYTFRYIDGTYEIARYLYPEIFDDVSKYDNNKVLTREDFAAITVKMLHVPTFINGRADYYDFERYNHTYGAYEDVSYKDEDFNIIETAAMRSFVKTHKKKDGTEYFGRNEVINKKDISDFLYIEFNIKQEESKKFIKDKYTNSEFIKLMNDIIKKQD